MPNHPAGITGWKRIIVITTAALIGWVCSIPVLAANKPRSPIKHVIVIVGENHSFDNLFGAYRPAGGQTVFNLLSEGIINRDGTPGPLFPESATMAGT